MHLHYASAHLDAVCIKYKMIRSCSEDTVCLNRLNLSSFLSWITGDILGLSISNLDSLIQMPLGCGEQNMIHFASSIYVLHYLDKSTLDNKEIRSRALGYMTEGKQ